jgi:hypothetical protein
VTTKATVYSVGIFTFVLSEVGVFVAVFLRSGGGTNDMGEVAAMVMCILTSPLCVFAAVVAGWAIRHQLSDRKISN